MDSPHVSRITDRASLARQIKPAAGDDIALNLVGAAGETGRRAGPVELLQPAAQADFLGAAAELPIATEQLHAGMVDSVAELAAPDLDHRALHPGDDPAVEEQGVLQVEHPVRL